MADMLSCSISGTDAIFRGLDRLDKNLERQVPSLVKQEATDCLTDAQANAPVESGYMRDSGHVEVIDDQHVEVQFDAPYSEFIEEGHMTVAGTFVPPQPFLMPSFQNHVKSLLSKLQSLSLE